MANFIFKKNVSGGLIFSLESYDFSLQRRTFDMPNGVNQLAIPEQYALGLFITDEAMNMYKMGYFTIENFDALKESAEKVGLFGELKNAPIYDGAQIKSIVEKNDMGKINLILSRKNPIELANIITVVRDNLNREDSTVSTALVRKIEDTCGVELTIE